jgi:hypothetical protein
MRRASLGISLLLASSAFAAPGSGDLWDVTTQMVIEGMPAGMGMPARTQQVCAAKEWNKPPVAQDPQHPCEIVDFKSTPTMSTWKMHCPGPPAMDGNGEISRSSPTAYKGYMKMSSEEGAVTINLSGRRVGDCDAEATKVDRDAQAAKIQSQIAAGQQAADDAKKQMCQAPVTSLNLVSLNQQAQFCEGPSYKAAFCEKLNTHAGWQTTCVREKSDAPNALVAAAAFCAADATELTKKGCDEEAKQKDENLDVIGRCCPELAKAIAQRECGGLQYSAQMGKYGSFCATYAKDLVGGGEGAPAPSPSPESSTSKTKRKIKSFIPH